MWIIKRQDGQELILPNEPSEADLADDANPIVAEALLERALAFDGTERYDWDLGAIVVDTARAEAWEDAKHRIAMGSASIDISHAIKQLEARLYRKGITLDDGLLVAEADATGQLLTDLVETVLASAEPEIAAEVDRIVTKRDIRAGD